MSNSPNGGLINETNEQYYVGHQSKVADGSTSYTFTFDEVLKMGNNDSSWDPNDPNFMLNNFDLMISTGGSDPYVLWDGVNGGILGGPYGFRVSQFSETQDWSTIEFFDSLTGIATSAVLAGYYIQVRLKSSLVDGAPNYGDYQYISIKDIVNNFLIGYVGQGKLIANVKRTDVMFHAKRGLQEFSYDTIKSVKSQELTIPPSLSVIIPQDYVNYVQVSWVDNNGIKRIIYPTRLTSNPTATPVQDQNINNSNYGFSFPSEGYGIPIQDQFGENIEGTSLTEEKWKSLPKHIIDYWNDIGGMVAWRRNWGLLGQRYGLDPELSQGNGWYTINEREGKFSFSSNLLGKLIILEYISDGLAYDEDTKVPKLAEQAMYMHIAYSILAGRSGVQEYIVQRYKKDKRSSLRNAKIRLSNTKLNEFVQTMRNKSKWIKY